MMDFTVRDTSLEAYNIRCKAASAGPEERIFFAGGLLVGWNWIGLDYSGHTVNPRAAGS
jgi:hypothetical protein